MLLVEFDCCRDGNSCGEGGGVGIPYFTVRRGRREGAEVDFGREAISDHDIGIFGVAVDVVGKVSEVGGVGNAAVAEGFFACFVRTCSCSLVLLGNLAGQRLHEKASAFSFAIRASSACCFLN